MNHQACKGHVMRGTSCLKDLNPTQHPKTPHLQNVHFKIN